VLGCRFVLRPHSRIQQWLPTIGSQALWMPHQRRLLSTGDFDKTFISQSHGFYENTIDFVTPLPKSGRTPTGTPHHAPWRWFRYHFFGTRMAELTNSSRMNRIWTSAQWAAITSERRYSVRGMRVTVCGRR